MDIETRLGQEITEALQTLYGIGPEALPVALQPTRKDFEGTHTFVVFPYLKAAKAKPEILGQSVGEHLLKHSSLVKKYNAVQGFLNLSLAEGQWVEQFEQIAENAGFGLLPANGRKVMVEYSSPNTNKPLHLGHLRNNFLGFSVAGILQAAGYEVIKANLVNDRGIHICKSMLAYQQFGKGETPASAGIKGDKLVGNYYVAFDKKYKVEIGILLEKYAAEGITGTEEELKKKAEKEAPLMLQAQEMLRKWELGDPETVSLWQTMNGWVYEGFKHTYEKIGVSFDQYYYESQTYLLGKDLVEEGLQKGIFYKKENGSVWADLTAEGLDHKLVLRADGTSVYITQDMGTADLKYRDYGVEKSIYVIGNEQDYHIQVLKVLMKKLGRPYADGMYHLSYGMVDLPSGKMKSREGTVVDADDLVDEMIQTAQDRTEKLGKIEGLGAEEAVKLYDTIALGALKYYLLKVEPKKRMLFNPEESIDFQGDTGVYIQYNHAKIRAILRKAEQLGIDYSPAGYRGFDALHDSEIEVVKVLSKFPDKVKEAAEEYAPSSIASYAYELSKAYSRFYADVSIFNEPDGQARSFRVALSGTVSKTLKRAFGLLGIAMPEKM